MKTTQHIDLLIDNETKVGMGYTPGHKDRKSFEARVCFLRECKMVLLAMNEESIKNQLELTKIRLNKYQEQKGEIEKDTSSTRIKTAMATLNDHFKPEKLRRYEETLLFILND